MTTRRVTEILGSVSVEGKAYGPFQATADRPYLEVPAGVADVMAWPVHESDPSQQAQADAEEGEGIHVDQILEANASLKADLDKAQAQVQDLEAQLAAQPSAGPVTLPADLRDKIAALKQISDAKADEIIDLIREALAPAPAPAPEADAK